MKKRFILLFALLTLLPVMALAELNYEVKNTHYIYFPDLHQMTAYFQDAENWIFVTPENLEENFDMVLARGGTEEEIRSDVCKNMAIFKPGGGFVFNPIHNIMGDIAPEKIVAVYDEAYRSSFYNV